MKKTIIAAIIAVSIATSAFADAGKSINEKAVSEFSSSFTKASNVAWTTTNDYFKATFTMDKEKVEAFYRLDGSFIGSSKAIAFDALPAKAVRIITQKYPFPPYKLKECIAFTFADGETLYYASFEEANNLRTVLEIDGWGGVGIFKKSKA
jgi:hypothetical protein